MMLGIGSRHATLGGRFGVKRCVGVSFYLSIQTTFLGSCVITLGARKHV